MPYTPTDALEHRFELFLPDRIPVTNINSKARDHSIFGISQSESRPRGLNQNRNNLMVVFLIADGRQCRPINTRLKR